MASRSRLLHLPLKDSSGRHDAHALLRVTPASDSSRAEPWPMDLFATQGSAVFVTTLKRDRVSQYREKSSCSKQEWEQHLVSLLVDQHPIGDLDVLAEADESNHLNIDIRKKTSGPAQQRLGTLRLRRSKTAEYNTGYNDIFGWCVDEVLARAQLEREVDDLRRKHAELEKLVAEETVHVQELERGKRDFEAVHDSLCRDLLNEKKLKIRNLEQALAAVPVDQQQAAAASTDTAGASRKGKRKAEDPEVDAAPGSGDETDNGPDRMEIDESDHNAAMATPETASESEPEPKPNKGKTRASPQSAAAQGSRKAAQQSRRGNKTTPDFDSEDDVAPGPPRGLPVNKKQKPVPAPDPAADDESTASE